MRYIVLKCRLAQGDFYSGKEKPRQDDPPGLRLTTTISRSRSWIEVVLEAQHARPDVGVSCRQCGDGVSRPQGSETKAALPAGRDRSDYSPKFDKR